MINHMIKWERSFLMSMMCSSPVQAINVAYLFLTLSKWKWANVEMVKSPLFCDLYQWPPSKLSLSNVISGWLSANQWHSDSQRIKIYL